MRRFVARAGRFATARCGTRGWGAALLAALLAASFAREGVAQTTVPAPDAVPIPSSAAFGREPQPEAALEAPALELDSAAAADVPGCGDVRTVYFATNRNPIPFVSRPERFGNELRRTTLFGSVRLEAGRCTIADGGIQVEIGNVGLALAEPLDFALAAASGTNEFTEALSLEADAPLSSFAAAAANPQEDVLVFIHGAAHTFQTAVSNGARLANAYRRDGVPITVLVFAYPTDGRSTPLSYFSDRREAGMSGFAMAEAFEKLVGFLDAVRFSREGRTVFVAHSLGVYAAREGIQAIARGRRHSDKVFDVAMLMAGDEDADSLSRDGKIRPLLELSERVAVYFAENDLLMAISTLGNLRVPIGRRGPSNIANEDFGDTLVSAIDAGAFSRDNDFTRHRYHLRSPRVVEDAARVFAGEAPDAIPGRTAVGPRVYRLEPLAQ